MATQTTMTHDISRTRTARGQRQRERDTPKTHVNGRYNATKKETSLERNATNKKNEATTRSRRREREPSPRRTHVFPLSAIAPCGELGLLNSDCFEYIELGVEDRGARCRPSSISACSPESSDVFFSSLHLLPFPPSFLCLWYARGSGVWPRCATMGLVQIAGSGQSCCWSGVIVRLTKGWAGRRALVPSECSRLSACVTG